MLIQRVSTGGSEQQFTATLQYVFVTTPALVSYDDGQGNSATVSYPGRLGGPGTEENPFPVKAGPDGDVVVELKFWRPQRRPIPPETAEWIDIGGLDLAALPRGRASSVGRARIRAGIRTWRLSMGASGMSSAGPGSGIWPAISPPAPTTPSPTGST